jgi:hypothetical protein
VIIADSGQFTDGHKLLNTNDENIDKIIDLQNSNLYFKYLKTIYPISDLYKLDPYLLKLILRPA